MDLKTQKDRVFGIIYHRVQALSFKKTKNDLLVRFRKYYKNLNLLQSNFGQKRVLNKYKQVKIIKHVNFCRNHQSPKHLSFTLLQNKHKSVLSFFNPNEEFRLYPNISDYSVYLNNKECARHLLYLRNIRNLKVAIDNKVAKYKQFPKPISRFLLETHLKGCKKLQSIYLTEFLTNDNPLIYFDALNANMSFLQSLNVKLHFCFTSSGKTFPADKLSNIYPNITEITFNQYINLDLILSVLQHSLKLKFLQHHVNSASKNNEQLFNVAYLSRIQELSHLQKLELDIHLQKDGDFEQFLSHFSLPTSAPIEILSLHFRLDFMTSLRLQHIDNNDNNNYEATPLYQNFYNQFSHVKSLKSFSFGTYYGKLHGIPFFDLLSPILNKIESLEHLTLSDSIYSDKQEEEPYELENLLDQIWHLRSTLKTISISSPDISTKVLKHSYRKDFPKLASFSLHGRICNAHSLLKAFNLQDEFSLRIDKIILKSESCYLELFKAFMIANPNCGYKLSIVTRKIDYKHFLQSFLDFIVIGKKFIMFNIQMYVSGDTYFGNSELETALKKFPIFSSVTIDDENRNELFHFSRESH